MKISEIENLDAQKNKNANLRPSSARKCLAISTVAKTHLSSQPETT
jgi:hypothetical protein